MSLFFRNLLKRVRRGLSQRPETRRPARRRTRLGLESLEGREVPATVNVDVFGALTYMAGADRADNLTVSYSNGNWTFSDPGDSISIGDAEVPLTSTGGGTTALTLTNAPITSISIVLDNLDNDKADTLVLQSSAVAVTVLTG